MATSLKRVQTAISPHSEPSLEIGELLIGLAEARQAHVTPETMYAYSKGLASFELDDVREAITRIGYRPRRDGETAFPDFGAIVAEVRAAREDRRRFATIDAINAEARKRQEQPENYTSWNEIMTSPEGKAIMHRHNRHKDQPAPETEMSQVCCPACDAVIPVMAGVRLMTSAELRQFADLREQQELRAEQRRIDARSVAAEIHSRDLRLAAAVPALKSPDGCMNAGAA